MFNGRCVSGPLRQIWPSLIVYMILFGVSGIWAGVCLPFLMKDDNPEFAEPVAPIITIDFILLLLSILTILSAIKTQVTDPGIIFRDAVAAAKQAKSQAGISDNDSGNSAHIYR